MIGKATLNSLLVGFVAVFCLLIHSPEVTATRTPGAQVPSHTPFQPCNRVRFSLNGSAVS